MDIKLFCVQCRGDYRNRFIFIYAESAQDAVDRFRHNHSEPIIDVFFVERLGDWN